jgi:hypothetical protein
MRTFTQYFSDDGKQFRDPEHCLAYEAKLKKKYEAIREKIGEFTPDEITVGNGLRKGHELPDGGYLG